MKATSIEQIREHLARGGRVIGRRARSTLKWNVYVPPIAFGDEWEYELLPLEEKEPVTFCDKCKFLSDPGDFCDPCWKLFKKLRSQEPVDHGTQKGQEEQPAENNHVKQLQSVIEQLTSHFSDQARKLDIHRKAYESMIFDALDARIDDDSDDIINDVEESLKARKESLREKVLHGFTWTQDECKELWHFLTGERIEWGKRCERCKASGRVKRLLPIGYDWITCLDCNGSGYSVRPTWMGEGK